MVSSSWVGKMVINAKKNWVHVFHRARFKEHIEKYSNSKVYLFDNEICLRLETIFLGVVIDSELKYEQHIKKLIGKLKALESSFYKISNQLSDKAKKMIYLGKALVPISPGYKSVSDVILQIRYELSLNLALLN